MKLSRTLGLFVLACALVSAIAQTYPVSNPTFIPNAVGTQATFAAPGDSYFVCAGVSGATLSIQGTFTGLTAVVRATNDTGTPSTSLNWTNVSARPVGFPPGPAVTSLTATGLFRVNCNGYTVLNLHVTAVSTGSAKARFVSSPASESVHAGFAGGDPCADPNIAKTTQPYAVSTAVTTLIKDSAAGKLIYPCSYQIVNHTAAAGSVQFEYGTKVSTDCDTGATAMTGVMDLPSTIGGTIQAFPGASFLGPTPAAKQLCIVNTGTSGLNGYVTFVQQ